MKKLIGILSSFTSVFSTSATIVSCGNNNQQESGNSGHGNKTGEEIDEESLKAKLSDEGIDGTMLNTNNTGIEILPLIKDVINNIEPTATNINFINTDEEASFLSKGDNYFTVSFDVKNKSLKFPVFVKNVQDADELDKDEIEIYVRGILNDPDILEVGYEDEDINTDDVTNWKKVIGQKICKKIKTATINIKTANTSDPKKLNVTIEVDNLPYGIQKITKKIQYTSNRVNPITNPVAGANTFDAAVAAINNLNFEAESSLTTNNKKKDALNSIEQNIIKWFKNQKLPKPQFEYDHFEMNKYLVEGKNEIKIGLKNPQTNKNTDISFILTDVQKEAQYNTYQNMIKERLSKGIDASKFNESNSYEYILPFLTAAAKEFEPYANIELKNKNQSKTLLKTGDNRIEVIVNLQGHQPISFTALLKGVKPFMILEEVKNYYESERGLKQNNPPYTYRSVIFDVYQGLIKNMFKDEGIVISLKDSSKLNQILPEGVTQIEVNYSQNGKTLSGIIKPSLPITKNPSNKPSQTDFEKIMPYVNNGITLPNLTTENNIYEAFLAISKFIEGLEPGVKVEWNGTNEILNNNLKLGNNIINVQISKYGVSFKKNSITLKNVTNKTNHSTPTQQNEDPQDKKFWDVYEVIKAPVLPAAMANRTKGDIASVLQKLIESKGMTGVRIMSGETVEVLKEKIVSKTNFLFKVYLKDTSTNRGIFVNLDVVIP